MNVTRGVRYGHGDPCVWTPQGTHLQRRMQRAQYFGGRLWSTKEAGTLIILRQDIVSNLEDIVEPPTPWEILQPLS